MAEFEVRCNVCNKELEADLVGSYHNRSVILEVEPCPDCLIKAKDEGFEEGEGNG